MLILFKTEVLKGLSLPELVKKARSGDLIVGLGQVRGQDIWAHFLGVMQRIRDDETDHIYFIGGERVFRGQCTTCFPFYETIIVRRGNEFFVDDHLYYKYPGKIESCQPHPSGAVVIEEGDRITILGKRSALGRKLRILNRAKRGFEERVYTPAGVMTRENNRFFFNGHPTFEWKKDWKNNEHWWPFGEQVLIRVKSEGGWTFFLNDNELYRINHYEDIILLPHIGDGRIVTREKFHFTVNGKALEREIPCDRSSFHHWGVLIERESEFSLLVVK